MTTPATPATTLSLGQAARLTGLGKTTLARAIRAGRLSATRNETGGYSIDAAELARVYPFPTRTEATGATDDVTATVKTTSAALTAEVAALREMLAMMREQVADAREERDRWRDQAQRLALTPPKPEPLPSPTPPAKSMTWWRWLRTTG
jgi:excisionase family DNA binding protein